MKFRAPDFWQGWVASKIKVLNGTSLACHVDKLLVLSRLRPFQGLSTICLRSKEIIIPIFPLIRKNLFCFFGVLEIVVVFGPYGSEIPSLLQRKVDVYDENRTGAPMIGSLAGRVPNLRGLGLLGFEGLGFRV